MSKVALMCGHGRSTDGTWDCGTSYGGNNEAALMLPITKAAVKYLRSYGVEVISDADTNNNKNMIVDVAWANKEKATVYVSLHCDYYKAPAGTLPLVYSAKGKVLATAINNAVVSGMKMKTRGVTKRTDLYELSATNMVATIFECGSIKLDIDKMKQSDKYGKCIAKGICDYLGVKVKETATTTPAAKAYTPTTPYTGALPSITVKSGSRGANAKALQTFLNWCINAKLDVDSIIGTKSVEALKKWQKQYGLDADGIFGAKSLAKAKQIVSAHAPKPTLTDKILEACKTQATWMKNAKYGDYSPVTLAHSKKAGTCVTYTGCVLQRLGYLKSGQYVWQNGKGYGTGKVTGTNDKMTVTYMNNKTLKSLKSKLKAGDLVLLDDNKSGKAGSGGHIFFITGKWTDKNNPYIWDMCPSRTCEKNSKPRAYSGDRKVLAVVRLKG